MSAECPEEVRDGHEVLQRLGMRIRQLREGRGWSLEELARRCGRHFSYIGRVERGQQNVSLVVLQSIAQALVVPCDALLQLEAHPLLEKWGVAAFDVLEAIDHGFRTQVDVRGKLAEWMLYKGLLRIRDDGRIEEVQWCDEDGKPDFIVEVEPCRQIVIECKNLRSPSSKNPEKEVFRVEIQKTRNSKDGAPSRFYGLEHFDILSVCLFNRTGTWEFLSVRSSDLARHGVHEGKLKVMQEVPRRENEKWRTRIEDLF